MPLNQQDRDLLVRTVMGEANGEPDAGQAGVAAVVLNRLRSGRYGQDMASVLFAPKQFEPWNTRRSELMGYNPASPQYQRASANVDALLSGKMADPTGGAVNFQNPGTVAGRGNTSGMSWFNSMVRNGSAVRIGNHVFGSPNGSPGAVSPSFSGTPGGTGAYDFAATVRPGLGSRVTGAIEAPIGANPLPQTPEEATPRRKTVGDVLADAIPAMSSEPAGLTGLAKAGEPEQMAFSPEFRRADPAEIIGAATAPLRGRVGRAFDDPANALAGRLPRLGDSIFA